MTKQDVIVHTKNWLHRSGLYPTARSVYRALSASHRRERRLRRRFFGELIRTGDLCFDIGANVGQTIEALVACGASVVALEPNVLCLPTLRHQFGADTRVTLISKAVGSAPGVAQLHFNDTAATASLRKDWNRQDDQTATIEVVTLAQLMANHGVPKLLKVDVEGFEVEVFTGLDRPIPIIYFEMHGEERAAVRQILRRLVELGTVIGVNAISEDHAHWLLEQWVSPDRFLESLPSAIRVCNVVVRMSHH